MSILIKGMKIPPCCSVCPCSYDNMCAVVNEYPTFTEWCNDRPEWCPLVELPPHGRLVDADVLVRDNGIKEIPEYYEVVCAAPTIIPAEDGE